MHNLQALGVDIFAGGFTLGVRNHFDILGHLEENSYGVRSVKLNMPHLPVHVGTSSWGPAITKFKQNHGHINFVYCNPPCALFSVAGATMRGGKDAWKKDPRQSCWRNCFSVFKAVKPDVFVIESVTRAYTAGIEFVNEFVNEALEMGYSATHLLIDAQYMGVPQRRKRYFMVLHNKHIQWVNPNWAPPMTVHEALSEVPDPGPVLDIKDDTQKLLLKDLKPGDALRPLWEDWMRKNVGPEDVWPRTPFGIKGRPRMFVHRVEPHKPLGTLTGDYFIHPTEDRFLGANELKRLNGFPTDYQFEGRPQYWASFIARGVCPPVGEWLARNVKSAIENGLPDSGNVYKVDLREPPKSIMA
jgi:DNA (cytosine-5)-methyltransferase 1